VKQPFQHQIVPGSEGRTSSKVAHTLPLPRVQVKPGNNMSSATRQDHIYIGGSANGTMSTPRAVAILTKVVYRGCTRLQLLRGGNKPGNSIHCGATQSSIKRLLFLVFRCLWHVLHTRTVQEVKVQEGHTHRPPWHN